MQKECFLFFFRGRPYLVKRKQAASNFRKFARGRLPDHDIVAGGPVIEARDIEGLIRAEVQKIGKKGRRLGSKPIIDKEVKRAR